MIHTSTGVIGTADFAAPIDDRYFDDYLPGATYEYGFVTTDADDMMDFARRYDPQPFHTDMETAKHTFFGGLIASGWQTSSMMMRLYADHYLTRVASLGSPGLDKLSWPAPVRPGDTLRLRVTVESARPSKSKPDRGIVTTRAQMLNQDDAVVLDTTAVNLIFTRDGGQATEPGS